MDAYPDDHCSEGKMVITVDFEVLQVVVIFPDRVKVEGQEFVFFPRITVPEKNTHVRRKFRLKIFKVDAILIMELP